MLIIKEIERLDALLIPPSLEPLAALSSQEKKDRLENESVRVFLQDHRWLYDIYEASDTLGKVTIASLISIGQGQHLLADPDELAGGWHKWQMLIEHLKEIELFYAPMGGLIGYQRELLHHLALQLGIKSSFAKDRVSYSQPPKIDIQRINRGVKEAILRAIQDWSKICFIMPVGGAGDRLGLQDESGKPLPAAFLSFEGCTLLEGLVRDVEAIELLIEDLTGQRIYTPLALMTSDEKGNHELIEQFLKENEYFGRPVESFRLFRQKLVPVVTEYGQWAIDGPLELMLKPGGHGVIWRAAQCEGVLQWLEDSGITHALVRQVNNPIAGSDYNLLSLAGFGLQNEQAIGFMSCDRAVHAAEGVNVLRKRYLEGESCAFNVTNIEYTDFAQEGLEQILDVPGDCANSWSSNTNLFVVQLKALQDAMAKDPFPGLILNLKSRATVRIGHELMSLRVARLESMMQNIADAMELVCRPGEEDLSQLNQFLLFNERRKTISTAKKNPPVEGFALETPLSAFYDKQRVWRDFLTAQCQIHMPLMGTPEEYFHRIAPFIVRLAPSLGPLHELIFKRLHSGTLALGSYLELELRQLIAHDIYLDGALRISASDLQKGYVFMKQVTVVNSGWSHTVVKDFWKGLTKPKESLHIQLEGKGAFIASQVNFEGSRTITVPDGTVVTALYEHGQLVLRQEPFETFEELEGQFLEIGQQWLADLNKC